MSAERGAGDGARSALVREVRGAIHATALVCGLLSAMMLVPAVAAVVHEEAGAFAFTLSAVVSGLVSLMIGLATAGVQPRLTPRFGFLVVNVMWWGATLVCAVPLMLGPVGLSFPDAVFETASGLTTTGSTVMSGLDTTDRGTLLWRAMTHLVGGFGILLLGLIVLPQLSVGGMQLFRMESSDRGDKPLPRFLSFSRAMLAIYAALLGSCTAGYLMTGMGPFDAATHAMATVSTGGFANYDASFAHFEGPGVLLVGALFMILGSLPLTLFVALASGPRRLRLDPQVKVFLGLVAAATLLVILGRSDGTPVSIQSVSAALFNVAAILSTTGFAAGDYTLWGPMIVPLVFIITFFGGCSGSTAGGLKTYRLVVMYELVKNALLQALNPRGVFLIRYGGRAVDPDIFRAAMVMVMVTFAATAFGSIALGATGLDFVTAISGAVTALANVGPGLGAVIGPAGNFASLPDAAKLILAGLMILGRLEILAVLVLFTARFWRE